MGTMHIDASAIDLKALLLKLKDILAAQVGYEVDIEIVFAAGADVQKVKAFAAMSGCKAEITSKDGKSHIHITGTPCCV